MLPLNERVPVRSSPSLIAFLMSCACYLLQDSVIRYVGCLDFLAYFIDLFGGLNHGALTSIWVGEKL